MELENIGFYTLSDDRAKSASMTSPLKRCELILSARCNFKCPYCRHVGGKDMKLSDAILVVAEWAKEGLENIRFSGGEPTLYPDLPYLVTLARNSGIKRIAISTNGSASLELYKDLIDRGVNDISISLDACCAEDIDKMAGRPGVAEIITSNIRELSKLTYVTVGVVLTEKNKSKLWDTIIFAHNLGVADIRIIPAAQDGRYLEYTDIPQEILEAHPILKYRIRNIRQGMSVRGIIEYDSKACGLVMDDMAVMGKHHYPCIIYMREGGKPIGEVGPNMRKDRAMWYLNHNTHEDPICRNNCLDVCVDYNNRFKEFHC